MANSSWLRKRAFLRGGRPEWWLLLVLLTAAGRGWALEPTTPLASYGRQSWVMENGLPQNTVQALAQTRDGFLWLGTEVGLVRFDGNGFQMFDRTSSPALPGNDVRCLLAAPDGPLWIGTSEGLARWKDGAMTVFTRASGMPGNTIAALRLDADGAVTVKTDGGGVRITGTNVSAVNLSEPSPASFSAVLPDGRTAQGNASSVELGGVPGTGAAKTEARWSVGKELPGTRVQALFADREGALWIGTNGGLTRWAEGKLERLPITDSLASASVLALLEDREGDMWVGTEAGGLHILRDQRFATVSTRNGLSSDNTTTVVEDAGGTLWVGTNGSGLNAVKTSAAEAEGVRSGANPVKVYTVRDGLPSDVILSLAAAPDGALWVGTPDGLSRIRRGVVTSFTSADGLPDDFIRSLLADADGSLWVGTRRGLTHWVNPGAGGSATRMETFTQANGLGSELVGAMTRDWVREGNEFRAGDLWVATFAGLSRLHDGKIVNYTTANGLSSNVITALLARKNGILLIGTQDHGWDQWDGRRFIAAEDQNFKKFDQLSVHAMLDEGTSHVWFATGNGIVRGECPLFLVDNLGVPPGDCLNWIEFTTADGLHSRETAINSHPSAWRSRDGHLWFATPKGLEEVDPAHFPVNAVSPPVALERFAVDDVPETLRGDQSVRVPAGHNHFQFDYAGLSFVAPQKVRYRFMLEGFDHAWTEAGARRTAYYTNIPPGHYTFRVQAANNDGLWNRQGAALHFELQPHFYQTVWFYVLLALALGGIVVLLLRLRLLRAEREFRAVLGERNRIAREIHDTLAQGYVGISVQLEVLSELLRHNKVDAAAKHLDTTRGYVREGLADARQSIWSLRSQDANENTLPVQIRRVVEGADGNGTEGRFSLFGAYRPLAPGTEREILRVAQEAIHNVKKHADAGSFTVQLEYGPAEIALEVRDDGRGFVVGSSNGTGPESPSGHYGLTGMRERAAAIGGTLEVASEPGAGTTVRLRAPAPKGIGG